MAETGTEEALRALSDDPDLKQLEDLLGEFNLFEVLQIWHLELQHSWVIAWLLDPHGSHGLGDAFLRVFLSQAAAAALEENTRIPSISDVNGWGFSNVEVARESDNIDILAISKDDGVVCLIENKIFSNEITGNEEQPGQLRRYMETVKANYPTLTPFPIFLTPDARKPQDARDQADYVSFGYGQVADIIDRVLQEHESTVSTPVSSFLEQYTRTLRRNILGTPSDVDELALHLYAKHRTAIDRITEAKKSFVALGWGITDEAIRTLEPHLRPDQHYPSAHSFFATCLDEIPDLKRAKEWTPSRRLVLFQVDYDGTTRELRLRIGPGPQHIRDRVFNVAQSKGLPFLKSDRDTPYPTYHRIYDRALLADSDISDADDAKAKAQRSIREFFEHDFWPLVNGIREEFGLGPASEADYQP